MPANVNTHAPNIMDERISPRNRCTGIVWLFRKVNKHERSVHNSSCMAKNYSSQVIKEKIDLQFFLCRLREESRVVINIRDSNMKKLLDLTVVFVVFLSSEDLRAPAWDWLIDNLLMRVREMESSRRSLFSAKPSRLLEAGRKMPTPWNKMADLTCTCF